MGVIRYLCKSCFISHGYFLFRPQNDNDANSCYYSASHTEHTDNYCSTDEHENIFQHTKLHSSDSGADLSEKNVVERHMEHISDDQVQQENVEPKDATTGSAEDNDEVMTEEPVEYHHERNNSLPELFGDQAHQQDWEKYWAKNGERLIWQSWIEKYIDYINPEYLDNMQFYEQNTMSADTNKITTGDSSEQVFTFDAKDIGKFNNVPESSTEIVISPPAKDTEEDLVVQGWNHLSPDSFMKQEDYHNYSHSRHYQHHHHLLQSPRCESINSSIPLTLGTTATDSMTNVTHMTISSYGFESSSHVSSDSTPTNSEESGHTVSSLSESEESDNQMTTRIANECERLLMKNKPEEHTAPATDKNSEEYWQMKWQQHVQEMYVKHYNEFMEAHRILQDEMSSSFKSDSGFLPGESAAAGCTKFSSKKRRKPGRKKHSLQRLVANLNLRSDLAKYSVKQQPKDIAPTDGEEKNNSSHQDPSHSDSTVVDTTEASLMESMGLPISFGRRSKIGGNGDDEEPPEERPVSLKRSHEADVEEVKPDHIKSQFELMGYIFNDKPDSPTISGEVVYRKKHVRLHTRMLKMFPSTSAIKPKHTYFDEDGNEINEQSGADTMHASSSDEEMGMVPAARLSASIVPQFTAQLSSDGNANEEIENQESSNKEENVNINLSIDQDYDSNCIDETAMIEIERQSLSSSKKEKKKKRKGKQMSMPVEIANDKVLKKYWYKRFSLFHLFDFGVRLDRGELSFLTMTLKAFAIIFI